MLETVLFRIQLDIFVISDIKLPVDVIQDTLSHHACLGNALKDSLIFISIVFLLLRDLLRCRLAYIINVIHESESFQHIFALI